MSARVSDEGPPLTVRKATEQDTDLLLGWRNDPVTLRWSRNPAAVEPAGHARWLRTVLASADRLLLVVEAPDGPVGTVRFDREAEGVWEVSVTVAPSRRGRGLGGRVLAEGEAFLRRERDAQADVTAVTAVVAEVHEDNAASAALFRAAGYQEHGRNGTFRVLRKSMEDT